jgi:heptosyltransferase-1
MFARADLMPANDPQRILIVRLSALGDVVMSSGLIPALRQRYPHAEISWLTEAPAAPLLRHNPRLKEVLIWPRAEWRALWQARNWTALWQAIRGFRTSLRSRQFDLVLDAQGLLKSGLCAWMTAAPRRISIMAREGSHLLMHERLVPPALKDRRISSEYRYLAAYLGAHDTAFELDLAVGAAPAHTAERQWREWGSPTRLALLCPFTTRAQKHWFEDRWVDLARELQAQGWFPVILGGPSDREAAERICAQLPHLVSVAGHLKLDESVALVARSQLLIGVDTGLTHMGTALHIPTVALFGSTCPYADATTPRTHILYDQLPCSPCRRHPTCAGRFDCMRQLTVARVLEAAQGVTSDRLPQ